MASEAEVRAIKPRFDTGDRRDWLPMVPAAGIELKGGSVKSLRRQTHLSANPARDRHGNLVDIDQETISRDLHCTRTETEPGGGTAERAGPAFRHRPMIAAWAIERNIDGGKRRWVGHATTPGGRVIGREHAADEADDRQPRRAIVADGVEIPPTIAIRRDVRIEAKSLNKAEAAWTPDSAAIGTPGPGCTPPPAR